MRFDHVGFGASDIMEALDLRGADFVRHSMAASIGMLAAIAQPHCRARGTGLGLAMARGLAQQSGGALAIRTTMNVGTTATLWLPVGAASPRRENGPIPPTAPGSCSSASPSAARSSPR